METKAQRWRRLTGARMVSLIDFHRKLGNCAKRKDYDFTEAQAQVLCAQMFRGVIANCEHYKVDPETVFAAPKLSVNVMKRIGVKTSNIQFRPLL